MKHGVFSVYDNKAAAYLPPFYQHTKGMAQRAFADAASDDSHAFYRNPDDYHLVQLGWFDDNTAMVEWFPNPMPLGTAREFRKPSPQDEFDLQGVAPAESGKPRAAPGSDERAARDLSDRLAAKPPIENRDYEIVPKAKIKG